jgi:subtilase family serine protease
VPPGVYAVIDPDRELPDKNRNNNQVKRSLALPDLAIQSLTWSRVAENLYEVTARVISQGAVAAGATDIRFRKDGPEGELVSQQTIPRLDVFRSYDALIRITLDGNETEALQVYAVVDEDKKITEFDEENNSASATKVV